MPNFANKKLKNDMKKIAICVLVALMITACGGGSATSEEKKAAEQLIDGAYRAKDYGLLLTLADSLEKNGALSTAEAYYWQGYASDRMMQHRAAEFYWQSAINEAKNSTDAEDLAIYAKSASYLANSQCVRGDYEEALKAAVPVAERLEALHCDTTSDYTNLLIFIGCCQSRNGQSEEASNESFDRAYKMHLANIEKTRTAEAYKNAIAGLINIAYNSIGISHFNDALTWTDRFGKLISEYEMRNDAQPDYVDKQWARYHIYRATALDGLGRQEEVLQAYGDYLRTAYSHTPESKMETAEFLIISKQWNEAADCYKALDAMLENEQMPFSLDNIQKMVLKKYRTNLLAGRSDSANVVARLICDSLDAAITQARHQDAKELETVHQKEAQIAEEQASATQKRMMHSLVVLALLLACFTVYGLFRRKATHRISKTLKQLNGDYAQLEETATAKERTACEQQHAHSIQATMLPGNSLRREDFDLYAMLTPSKGVSGDLYDFFIRDDKLFFCVGSTGSKGVDASLAMAVTRLRFRTASAYEDQPERIVATINSEAVGASDKLPPVTLFAGVLDLTTGRLSYCNAGHCSPVLIGSGVGMLPVDPNSAIGQGADTTFTAQDTLIDPGSVIFAYTEGLPNARNKEQAPFEQRRILGEALQAIHGLDPSPQPLIERMTEALSRFTGDTEQSGDITMLAIRFLKQHGDGRYQRSITMSNDPQEMLRLTTFVEKVCDVLQINRKGTAETVRLLEDAVKGMAEEAYPDGKKGDIHVEAVADNKQLQFVIRAGASEKNLKFEI